MTGLWVTATGAHIIRALISTRLLSLACVISKLGGWGYDAQWSSIISWTIIKNFVN